MKNNKNKTEENAEDTREKQSLTILLISTIVVFIALISAIIGLWFSRENDKKKNPEIGYISENGMVKGVSSSNPEYLTRLADGLKKAGFVLYGSSSDISTKQEMGTFGQAFSLLDYVECDPGSPNSNPQECVARGIDQYPTWVTGEKKFSGYKSLEELEVLLNSN